MMKIFILSLLLLSSLYGAKIDTFANESFYYRGYDLALSVARKEQKIIMLVIVADFCPWCKKFERKTLQNELVAKLIKKNFIPIIVDNYRDKKFYPNKFSTKKLPAVYFIDSNTQETISKSILYIKKNDFLSTIQKVIKINKDSKND